MKTIIYVIISVIVLYLIVSVGIPITVSWWSSFYRDCNAIEIGMSSTDVERIMQPYFNNSKYQVNTGGGYFFYTESLFDDFQCNIALHDGKVESVEKIFE